MSGAAGGSRINRENLKQTIRNYRDNVLKPLGLDGSYNITGVRNRKDKYSYGDIDIVLAFKGDTPQGGDIKKYRTELKQELAKFLSQLDEIPTMPHKGNKKYFIHGNIVSTLYPIANRDGEYVQIDNIVSIGKEEGKFTHGMLDLTAEKQTLAIALIKTVFSELDDKEVQSLFEKLGINNPEQPGEDQEYDFNLNPTELSLNIAPQPGKTGKERQIWRSTNMKDVVTILTTLGIDIYDNSIDAFEKIIEKVKNFKDRDGRSIRRFKGLFNKNINVGDAEIGTEKGNLKQQAKKTVSDIPEKEPNKQIAEAIEGSPQKVIAVFPGKFKPPHKDHIARIKAAAADADEVIVLVSPKTEPGGNPKSKKEQQKIQDRLQDEQSVTADQTLQIFKLLNLPSNVKVFRSDDSSLPVPAASPVVSAYEIFKANPNQQYIAVFGKEEDLRRFGEVPENVQVKNYDNAAGNLSATDVRIALKTGGDLTPYLPDGVDQQKYRDIIVGKSIEDKMLDTIDEVLASFFPKKVVKEGSSGTPIAASSAIPSADRAELNKLYDDLKQYVPNERFKVDFQQDRIVITNKVENPISFDYTPFQGKLTEMQGDSFDYTPYLASILGYMLDKRMNILPLPDIKIKKDPEQANDFFGKTAYYRPDSMEVMLYTLGRHPKDVCRSFTHEMIHHIQNLEGRIGGGKINTSNVNEDDYLKEIEKEAYLLGNITFREWTDKQSKNGDSKKKVMAEGRYDTITNRVSSAIFNHWKREVEAGKKTSSFSDFFESDDVSFDVRATLGLRQGTKKLKVDGGADYSPEGEYDDAIMVTFQIDPTMLPEFWEEISMNLKDVIRHEIEHLTHGNSDNLNLGKYMEDDQYIRDLIKLKLLKNKEYFLLPKEVDANLQGMYLRAKKERRPFADVVNTYLDAQKIKPQEKEEILALWRKRMPALGIRQSL